MSDVPVGAEARPGRGPPKKRRRVVISCVECHRRKQKCDRELPCTNCKSRNRESYCTYEQGAPTTRQRDDHSGNSALYERDSDAEDKRDEPLSSAATAWGYSQTGASTIGFLKKIESVGTDSEDAMQDPKPQRSRQDNFALREKYRGLIRQLPAKIFIDKLVEIFLKEINWQYLFIDPDIFYSQLDEWNNLPYSVLSSEGPYGLPRDLRTFPAVLFQMIATAVLVRPEGPDSAFETLKYSSSMTFEDLAADYSESGAAIVNLFGKTNLSITTVQAQFLRASFLKITANVAESWHMVAVAIRDAQELGMHHDCLDPKPANSDVETVLENRWLIERRRKMYMILAIWDIHMCLVLGRPGNMDWRHTLPSLPIDARLPTDRSKTPIVPRNEASEPPTALTRIIFLYKAIVPLRDIQDLEQDGPYPKDFTKVDKVHQKIMDINDSKPAVFRLQNPDTRWDEDPNLYWIKAARLYLEQIHLFNLMALHRPYVFHREKSREEALLTSLDMLEIQRQMFIGLPSLTWRNFNLFFGSFDAVTLIASIYILFPQEHPEHREHALQHLRWSIDRFSAMQERNPLARSGLGILRAIVARFKKAIGNGTPVVKQVASSETPATSWTTTDTTSVSRAVNDLNSVGSSSGPLMLVGGDAPGLSTASLTGVWEIPADDNLAGIAPMFATGDLIYNDLTAFQDGDVLPSSSHNELNETNGMDGPLGWQFGGDIGQDTLWQFLNQYHPAISGS